MSAMPMISRRPPARGLLSRLADGAATLMLALLTATVLAALALIAPVLLTAVLDGLPPQPCMGGERPHAWRSCDIVTVPARPPAKGALAPPAHSSP